MNVHVDSTVTWCYSSPRTYFGFQAFVQLVNMERERAETERRKEEEERRRKKEEQQRRKRILEAAFDGDMDEINQVLREVNKQGSIQ